MGKKRREDQAMVNVRTLFQESGLSLVELGKRMGYSEHTARQAAWQFMKSHDPRMSMLRKFAEAMGITVDQLNIRRKKMSRKLQDELKECGCELEPEQFRELLEERKMTTSPAWTIDDLVCHPDEAKNFCNLIRQETNCPKMADDLILRTLMNVRRSH